MNNDMPDYEFEGLSPKLRDLYKLLIDVNRCLANRTVGGEGPIAFKMWLLGQIEQETQPNRVDWIPYDDVSKKVVVGTSEGGYRLHTIASSCKTGDK